jgi:hypothetical protein
MATAFVGLYWLFKLGTYSPCYVGTFGEVSSLSGFDFEITEIDCWHTPTVSVFVAKAGHSTKSRLVGYYRGGNPPPTITLVGKNTVHISLQPADGIYCWRETWGPLRIKYEVASVDNSRRYNKLPACR